MFPFPFGLKGMAIAAAIGFLSGSIAGGDLVRRYYKHSIAQAEVAALKKDKKAADDAARNDRARAEFAEAERARKEIEADELRSKITIGVCFPADDAGRLRQLWRSPVPPAGRGGIRHLLQPQRTPSG